MQMIIKYSKIYLIITINRWEEHYGYRDKRKKILLIGNGFDLAHGLPTSYSYFLDFVIKYQGYLHI